MKTPYQIAQVITGLNTGGAEMMLYKLLTGLDRAQFRAEVISLGGDGPVGNFIRGLGVPVRCLGMRPGVPDPRKVLELARLLRSTKPDLVQTWMYHADLVGGLAAKMAGSPPVIWGIRISDLSPERNKRSTIWTARGSALLSRWLPEKIVVNSHAAHKAHVRGGYSEKKMVFIPNGFDLKDFWPNPTSRFAVRQELGIPSDGLLVGVVGRFDPQKDYQTFIQAAGRLAAGNSNLYFLLCGKEVTRENSTLAEWIRQAGIGERTFLLGRRDDIPRLMPSLDLFVSSSIAEGFSNVVGEAMACAVPCVVTRVGDSAEIVGQTGRAVAPRDPAALADACREILSLPVEQRKVIGAAARQRMQQNYDLPVVVDMFENLYRQVLKI